MKVTKRQQFLAENLLGKEAVFQERKCSGAVRRHKRSNIIVKHGGRLWGCVGDHGKRCKGGKTFWYLGKISTGPLTCFVINGTGNTPQLALRDAIKRKSASRKRWAEWMEQD